MTMEIQQLMWKMEGIREAFQTAVYVDGDVDAAMGALADDCSLVNVPTETGGRSTEEIRRYLTDDVVPHRPADLTFRRLSRTADQRRVVAETAVTFTHDRPMPWLLPGVEPTHRTAEVLAVSVVAFKHRSSQGSVTSRISVHRTLWDHLGMLNQLGVDPADLSPARHLGV